MDYTKESFENWLKEISTKLATITGDFAEKNKLILDYTSKSLDALEKWMLQEYDVAADLREEEDLLDMLSLYVGETFIRYIGGEWNVDFENDKSIHYKKIVMRYEEDGELCYRSSKALCTSCISRKRGNLLSNTLKKTISKKNQLN